MKTVSQIWIYPIKGCRGISVLQAEVTLTGLEHDREFVLVDSEGKFLSQRRFPKMSLLSTMIEDNTLIVHPGFSQTLTELTIPLTRHPYLPPSIPVDIWGKLGYGIPVGDDEDEWFSEYLGIHCRLLRYDDRKPRVRNPKDMEGPGIPLSFADGFPILVIGDKSLTDLNSRMSNPVDINRFRPNIVFTGGFEPFEEDAWGTVSIGSARLTGQKLCERCAVPLVDQSTGISDKAEPLATLKTYRRIPSAPGNKVGPVVFGKNLSVMRPGIIFLQNAVIAT